MREQVAPMAATIRLTTDAIVAAARAETGLHDLGPEEASWRERMDVYTTALRTEGGLAPMGVVSQWSQLVANTRNRLRIEALIASEPSILDIPIVRPIIICGLPRTGTTHLHNLLSADPALRSLPYWESLEPVPAPGEGIEERRARTAGGLDILNTALPYFCRMHEMTTDHVHEEIQLLAIDASTMLFETSAPVPSWRNYYLSHDQTPRYQYLRRVLQVLTHLRGGTRWVLKSPQHLEQFAALATVFPDATFVVTHRDAVSVTLSMATMLAYTARLAVTEVDPLAIGRDWSDRLHRGARPPLVTGESVDRRALRRVHARRPGDGAPHLCPRRPTVATCVVSRNAVVYRRSSSGEVRRRPVRPHPARARSGRTTPAIRVLCRPIRRNPRTGLARAPVLGALRLTGATECNQNQGSTRRWSRPRSYPDAMARTWFVVVAAASVLAVGCARTATKPQAQSQVTAATTVTSSVRSTAAPKPTPTPPTTTTALPTAAASITSSTTATTTSTATVSSIEATDTVPPGDVSSEDSAPDRTAAPTPSVPATATTAIVTTRPPVFSNGDVPEVLGMECLPTGAKVTCSWGSLPDASVPRLLRGENGSPAGRVFSPPAGTASYLDPTTTTGVTYTYQLQAVGRTGVVLATSPLVNLACCS
jgi:hypothetical protein